ncbi:MAG: helix-turn-helix domain-containing protein [Devosia sp.]
MTTSPPEIGPALLAARKARRLTLEQLAQLSSVSRSMLSQIERGETNPTFAVLWNLTQALGIDFADLIAGGPNASQPAIATMTPAQTPEIIGGGGSCRLRILSPARLAGLSEWYLLDIDAGGVLESAPHPEGAFEHFTALSGRFEIRAGNEVRTLSAGETARYPADREHAIANTGTGPASGLLVLLYGRNAGS